MIWKYMEFIWKMDMEHLWWNLYGLFRGEMIWKSWDYMEIPIKPHIIHINFYAILIQFNDMGLYEIELDWIGISWEVIWITWCFMDISLDFFMDLVGIYVGIYLGIYVRLLPDDLELCGVIRDLMGEIIWESTWDFIGIWPYTRIQMSCNLHWEKWWYTGDSILWLGYTMRYWTNHTGFGCVRNGGTILCLLFPFVLKYLKNMFWKMLAEQKSGWWYTYPSAKYEFARWDDESSNI